MQNRDMFEKFNLLKRKFNDEKKENNESYARLLKRRRLELKRTLEEVASGVCSTSYLSRIENAQVEVDDQFLKHLFDKLELSYDDVKEQNKSDILKELIKKFLQDDYLQMNKIVNEAIECKAYSDVELKLMMLFQNIVDGHYEEARLTIMDLDQVVQTLIGKELVIFTYLSTLYAYKINNLLTAYRYVRILLAIIFEDETMRQAVNDLALSIYSLVDEDLLATECYYYLEGCKISKLSKSRMLMHHIEMSTIMGKYDFSKAIDAYTEIKDIISQHSKELLEHYQYNLIKLYIFNHHFDDALKLIDESVKSAKIITLLDYCLNAQNDFCQSVIYLEELRNFQFSKYESFHMFYNEYTIKRIEKNNNMEIIDFIRRNLIYGIFELKNSFILQNINYNYMEALFEIGKYKEAAKFAIRLLESNY